MLKRFKSVSMILLAGALGFTGNAVANPNTGNPAIDISQQDTKITGTVEDEFGPVAGASVVIKGTTNGTMTDMDGHFTAGRCKEGRHYPNILHWLCHTRYSLHRTNRSQC